MYLGRWYPYTYESDNKSVLAVCVALIDFSRTCILNRGSFYRNKVEYDRATAQPFGLGINTIVSPWGNTER
jgi:hypothetical protein